MNLSVNLQHQLGDFRMNVDFEAPRGITVILGRSGAGKTTIVNAVAGLLNPKAGKIVLDDMLLYDSETGQSLPPHKRRIGYIFQESRLFPHLTVQQNLTYGTRFTPEPLAETDTNHIIKLLGLEPFLDRRPARLSGGEKQRVAIGRAFLSNPKLILADEPLSNLDENRKQEILPYFERLRDEVDVPILYVSHAAAEVTRLATTVVALQNGHVHRQGPAAEVLSDPVVTPLGAQAAGSMLIGRLEQHHDDGLSTVIAGGVDLLLPEVPHPVGSLLRLRINAQDVMIAKTRPQDISALNVFPVVIKNIRRGDGPGVLVQLQAKENKFLARVTRRSADALGLAEGTEVFAVLKAVSFARTTIGDSAEHPSPDN